MATALGKQKQDDSREQQIRRRIPQAMRELPTVAMETSTTICEFHIRLQPPTLEETNSPLRTILSFAG
jgi:hypothetical protein